MGFNGDRPAELAPMTTPNSLMKKLRGYFTDTNATTALRT